MKIGVPKEIKTNENRIALVPAGAEALVAAGHSVFIERGAGEGSGFTDELYTRVGATIAPDADAVWREAEMIMKVKEPIAPEWPRMRKGQLLFTYFHFAADEELTRAHLEERRDVRRVRDRRAAVARAAAADADVRGRGPDGGAGGREVPREALRRPRRAARRRARRRAGQGRRSSAAASSGSTPRRWRPGIGAKVVILDISLERLRYLSRRDAGERRADPLEPAQHPGADRDGRSRGRGGADPGRQGADAGPPRGPAS